jgi:hypothetical protein
MPPSCSGACAATRCERESVCVCLYVRARPALGSLCVCVCVCVRLAAKNQDEVALLEEMREFLKRRSEIESTYQEQLGRLASTTLAARKRASAPPPPGGKEKEDKKWVPYPPHAHT